MKSLIVFVSLIIATTSYAVLPSPPIFVTGPQGRPLSGATFSVTTLAGVPETVYSDPNGTVEHSLSLGSTGLLQFWAAEDTYVVTVSTSGFSRVFYVDIPGTASAIVDGDFSGSNGLLRKLSSGTYAVVKVKYDGTDDPTVNDDSGDGYVIGSTWINLVENTVFMAMDVSVGAAEWQEITGATSAITSLGGLTGATQTFAYGASGTAPNWSSSGTTHTLNLPLAASTVTAGLISNTDQPITGNKTFFGNLGNSDGNLLGNMSQGAYSFYFPGDTDSLLFAINGQLDAVGVGTITPTLAKLQVSQTGILPAIYADSTATTVIQAVRASNSATDPVVYVDQNGATSATDVVRIDNSGTTNYPFKIRNNAGTSQMAVYANGTISAGDGSVSRPSYNFADDLDSGVNYDTGASTIDIIHNGVSRVNINEGQATFSGEMSIGGVTGSGKAVCVKADGNLGVCSDAVGGSGTCTCG